MFQTSLDILDKLCISSSCITSPSFVKVSNIACHRSIQTSNSSLTLLDGGSLATHSSQDAGRHSQVMSNHKRCHQGCFGWVPDAQGSVIAGI